MDKFWVDGENGQAQGFFMAVGARKYFGAFSREILEPGDGERGTIQWESHSFQVDSEGQSKFLPKQNLEMLIFSFNWIGILG